MISEFREAEILGTFGQLCFDRVADLYMDDWLDRPFDAITRIDVAARFAMLWKQCRLDDGRWFLQSHRALVRFAQNAHPELKLPEDLIVNLLAEPGAEQ
jgi:hypothetical protein